MTDLPLPRLFIAVALFVPVLAAAQANKPPAAAPPGPGDEMLREYFRTETAAMAKASPLASVLTADAWATKRPEYRRQLAEMLGLDPMPPRTDLKPVVTGKLDHPQFTVEMLHFQSMPGLYVTGNLYLPKNLGKPAPTVLYVCGHSLVKKDGVSYGNKTGYQHWGAWFARNGYACLVIDTLQLGEIEGIHHGTYREKMWWWHSRGYTPAGVEAWNSIRALDYLETRPEIDRARLGVTGRSGGGAYSWYLAALDDRVKVAVPTAGITDLRNHVVDGVVEGHCDCMYHVNTYRWDYAQVAALIAPRPLLIQNTDKDPIFPLDGVYRIHQQTRSVYDLPKSSPKSLGLTVTEGPHKDTQDLQVPAFRWFNRHFKTDESPVETLATTLFQPEQLKVFKELPADQVNTKIQEAFVSQAPPPKVPSDKADWERTRSGWMAALKEKSFRGWPTDPGQLDVRPVSTETAHGVTLATYEFTSQHHVPLRLFVLQHEKLANPELTVLTVFDDAAWEKWLAETASAFPKLGGAANPNATFESTRKMLNDHKWAMAFVAPRGVGPAAYTADEKERTHIRRRYALLGQTLEGMQVWDVRRAVQAVRSLPQIGRAPLWLQAERRAAGVALYASLFESGVVRLDLHDLPRSHAQGPHFLNVLKALDMPAAAAMAAERSRVVIYGREKATDWDYPQAVTKAMGWSEEQVTIR
jgi:dienelactone hydrolase